MSWQGELREAAEAARERRGRLQPWWVKFDTDCDRLWATTPESGDGWTLCAIARTLYAMGRTFDVAESTDPKQYKNVRNMILALGEKMSVQVIDAQAHAGCGLWNIGYWIGNDPFGSGYKIHPNAIGKELWASYIANELNKQWYTSNVATT